MIVFIISTLQFNNKSSCIRFSSHCSFNTSVGTLISTKASGLRLTNNLIADIAVLVLPKPVQAKIAPCP